MHDPISFGAFWGFANVKDQSFLDANFTSLCHDYFVSTGGLPIPRPGNPVGSGSIGVLAVSRTEKIPFFFTKYCLTY